MENARNEPQLSPLHTNKFCSKKKKKKKTIWKACEKISKKQINHTTTYHMSEREKCKQ